MNELKAHMVHTHSGVPIEVKSGFPRIEFKPIRLHHRLTEIELVIMSFDKTCIFEFMTTHKITCSGQYPIRVDAMYKEVGIALPGRSK